MTEIQEVIEKLEELNKALGIKSIASPTSSALPKANKLHTIKPHKIDQPQAIKVPSVKKVSATPASNKDPNAVAAQKPKGLQRDAAKVKAKIETNAIQNSNKMVFKSEDNSLFYVFDTSGDRIFSEPHTKTFILKNVEDAENLHFVPVKEEKILTRSDGTWYFE